MSTKLESAIRMDVLVGGGHIYGRDGIYSFVVDIFTR